MCWTPALTLVTFLRTDIMRIQRSGCSRPGANRKFLHNMSVSNEWYPDPNWRRMGFDTPPDVDSSGKSVGIVVIDDECFHPTLRHLGDRLKEIVVADNLRASIVNVFDNPKAYANSMYTHGVGSPLLIASEPYRINNDIHVGLAPAATFFYIKFILDYKQLWVF